jgi:type IV secretory pathway TraG/TraD family ATPase VirD4
MKKMEALPQGLSELRKYGGCILAGLQSLNQIFDIYGRYSGSTMIGQFATKFIFRTEELSNIEMITETSGKAEYLEHNKNISYGAHEYREGISYAEHKREKPLISAGDLASLKTLECYVRLPEPEISVAKITTDYLPAPKNPAPFFVPKGGG